MQIENEHKFKAFLVGLARTVADEEYRFVDDVDCDEQLTEGIADITRQLLMQIFHVANKFPEPPGMTLEVDRCVRSDGIYGTTYKFSRSDSLVSRSDDRP